MKHEHDAQSDDAAQEHAKQQAYREREHSASDLATSQNRPPTEQHRGGPLPYQKK